MGDYIRFRSSEVESDIHLDRSAAYSRMIYSQTINEARFRHQSILLRRNDLWAFL